MKSEHVTHSVCELRSSGWNSTPKQSGIYWWFFDPSCLDLFGINEHCGHPLKLRTNESEKLCLYVGIAKNLRQRIKWHAEQPLRQSALRSGFISTFRKTLLALNKIDYATGFEQINQFMDGLDLRWETTPSPELAKAIEAKELGGEYDFPLNIQGNKSTELKPFIRYLKQQRKEYKDRHLAPKAAPSKTANLRPAKTTAFPIFQSRAKQTGESDRQIYLVSCVGKKLPKASPAKDLYISSWFKKARSYVESQGVEWFILSAKYGLIRPEQVIEPYELTLNRMKKPERKQWADSVFNQLQDHVAPAQSVTFLAGQKYREFLEIWLQHNSIDVDVPMKALGIGKQLKWLSDSELKLANDRLRRR